MLAKTLIILKYELSGYRILINTITAILKWIGMMLGTELRLFAMGIFLALTKLIFRRAIFAQRNSGAIDMSLSATGLREQKTMADYIKREDAIMIGEDYK